MYICQLHNVYIYNSSLYKSLCHCSAANHKVVKFTERSWRTFKTSAETHQDSVYQDCFGDKASTYITTPHNGYHRLCYQLYTSSSKLKKFTDIMPLGSQCTPSLTSRRRSVTRLSVPNFDISCCLFCQDTKFVHKFASRRRVIAKLKKCCTLAAAKKIEDATQARNDEAVLRRIGGGDLVAMNILYHKSCYATFTSKEHIQRAITPRIASEFDPCKISFDCIREKVHTYVIYNKTILPLSLLKSIYIQELNRNGVTISHYRTEKLKHRIEKEFGNAVGFYLPTDTS